MTKCQRGALLLLASLVVPATGLHAQEPEHAGQHATMHAPEVEAFLTEMASDLETVKEKLVGLAEAIPADTWDWRPGDGVRSVREVFLHVVADNYFFPAALGEPAPASTGITVDNYEALGAFEKRQLSQDETVAQLNASFDHLIGSVRDADATQIGAEVSLFGQSFEQRRLFVLMTTHVHEHLGQMIAYARTNGVVPPWSM